MRILTFTRFTLVFCFVVLLSFPFLSFARPVISEVMWMGSDLATQDEWLELTSIDGDSDLSGWKVTSVNTSGTEVTIIQFASGTTLPTGQYRVIARYGAAQSRLLEDPWFIAPAITLPNSKLLLRLRDAQGQVLDQADDGVGEPFAGENPAGGPKASMERANLYGSGAVKATWITSTSTMGWDEGAPILGSPGFAAQSSSSSSSSSSSDSSSSSSSSLNGEEPSQNCINPEHIFISELLPDAVGSDEGAEWVELYNPTADVWTIADWTLDLGGQTKYDMPGFVLEPGGYGLVPTGDLGVTLTNAGGVVVLRDSEARECDRVTYPKMDAGVTYARDAGMQWAKQCYATPGLPNATPAWAPELAVESGATIGTGKTKVNFILTTVEGFAGPLQCSMDFGDGQKSQNCNPAWHTYGSPGTYTAVMNAANFCGTTVIRSQDIYVLQKTNSSSSSALKSTIATLSLGKNISSTNLPLIISAALPNPAGDDKGKEWVEVTNTSAAPVQVTGLVFATTKKAGEPLQSERFEPREKRRYMVSLLGVQLGNEDSGIELRGPDGEVLSSLRWGTAREGVVYRFSSFGTARLGRVTKVIDGDTFEVRLDGDDRDEEVRLIGVDAPETVHPKKKVEPFGIEASNYLKALIEKEKIELQFDADERDVYGRILAYVSVLPEKLSVQEDMLAKGMTRADEQYMYSKKESYLALQDQAKEDEVGMWTTESSSKKSVSSSAKSSKATKAASTAPAQSFVSPYESKAVYANVLGEGNAGDIDPAASHIDDEALYASLLDDQSQFALADDGNSGSFSLGTVFLLLAVNICTLFGALGAGFFVAQRLQNSPVKVHS